MKIPNCCKAATKKACGIEKSLYSRGSPSDVKMAIGVVIVYFYAKYNQVVCRKQVRTDSASIFSLAG